MGGQPPCCDASRGAVVQPSCLVGGKRDLLLCVTASRRLCRGLPARATWPACARHRGPRNSDLALWTYVLVSPAPSREMRAGGSVRCGLEAERRGRRIAREIERMREVEALPVLAAERAERLELVLGLDALRHHVEVERVREVDDHAHERA